MAKIQKGDKVYWFRNWDSNGTCGFRLVNVESWGVKQATVRKTSGDMAQERIYPGQDWQGAFILQSECADPVAVALTLGAKFADVRRAHLQGILDGTIYPGTHSQQYYAAIRGDLDKVHEPRALNLDDAAAVDAAFADYKARK